MPEMPYLTIRDGRGWRTEREKECGISRHCWANTEQPLLPAAASPSPRSLQVSPPSSLLLHPPGTVMDGGGQEERDTDGNVVTISQTQQLESFRNTFLFLKWKNQDWKIYFFWFSNKNRRVKPITENFWNFKNNISTLLVF